MKSSRLSPCSTTGGDFKEATLELVRQGYGSPPEATRQDDAEKPGEIRPEPPAGGNVVSFPSGQPKVSIEETLHRAGFDELTKDSPLDDIEKVIRDHVSPLGGILEGVEIVGVNELDIGQNDPSLCLNHLSADSGVHVSDEPPHQEPKAVLPPGGRGKAEFVLRWELLQDLRPGHGR